MVSEGEEDNVIKEETPDPNIVTEELAVGGEETGGEETGVEQIEGEEAGGEELEGEKADGAGSEETEVEEVGGEEAEVGETGSEETEVEARDVEKDQVEEEGEAVEGEETEGEEAGDEQIEEEKAEGEPVEGEEREEAVIGEEEEAGSEQVKGEESEVEGSLGEESLRAYEDEGEILETEKEDKLTISDTTSSLQPSELAGRGTITGDFLPAGGKRKSSIFPTELTDIISELTTTESKDELKGQSPEEDKSVAIDREAYYELYDKLDRQYRGEKAKNVFLISRLAKYFQKRKMFHVLQEGKILQDTWKKYEKQLDNFDSVTERNKKELAQLRKEVKDLKTKLETKEKQLQVCFEKLQSKEYEVGKEASSDPSAEKIIDRHLKRQKIQLNNLRNIRLDFIKIRNRVAETQEALDALDNLGPHLRLIDYERLKHDNRSLLDKLEEKNLELTQVRNRCQHAMQILAHRREKTAALDIDIYFLNERLEGVTGEYEDVREQLNQLKQQRDSYRNAIYKMKKESGLLSLPTLLRDMSETIQQSKQLKLQVQEIKKDYVVTADMVMKIRKNMASPSKIELIKSKMGGGPAFFSSDDISSLTTSGSSGE